MTIHASTHLRKRPPQAPHPTLHGYVYTLSPYLHYYYLSLHRGAQSYVAKESLTYQKLSTITCYG